MNITVYLGANSGNDPTLETSVRALGRLIGNSGNDFGQKGTSFYEYHRISRREQRQ